MFHKKVSAHIHNEQLNMLKRFRYFMKLAVEYNYFFVTAQFFLKVMEVWWIKNNDISIASLHCKLFKTP